VAALAFDGLGRMLALRVKLPALTAAYSLCPIAVTTEMGLASLFSSKLE
jgi:hypothetical protein